MKTKEIIDPCRKNQEIQKFGMKQFKQKNHIFTIDFFE